MEDIIKLRSFSNFNNYLKRMGKLDGSESYSYVLRTSSPSFFDVLYDEITKSKYIKIPGSSIIKEKEFLREANAIVESIDFVAGYGHIITFKKD